MQQPRMSDAEPTPVPEEHLHEDEAHQHTRDARRRNPKKGGLFAEMQDLRGKLQEQQATLEAIKNALNAAAFSLNGRHVSHDTELGRPLLAEARGNNTNNNNNHYNSNHGRSEGSRGYHGHRPNDNYMGTNNYNPNARGGYGRRYTQRSRSTGPPPFE